MNKKSYKGKKYNKGNNNSGIALDFTSLQIQAMNELKSLYSSERGRKYSREQIRKFLENPQMYEKHLREASLYLASTSSQYLRLILYMAKMLTLDYIVVPYGIKPEDVTNKAFITNYKKSEDYMKTFNVKHELGKILTVVMMEDVFYGYERRVGDSCMIQRLPSNYCKIIGMEDGLFTFAFNMEYFNSDKSKLANFPDEFEEMYRQYKATHQAWQPVNTKKAVCFKFREDLTYALPPFTAIFEEVLDLEDLKDLVKSKNKLENFKLLLQKIPFKKDPKSEKDFLISLPSVKMFHNNIKAVLPEQIGLISSPMDIEEFDFQPKSSSLKNSVLEAEEEIFNSAGISSALFNSGNKTSTGLNKAIVTDEGLMFGMLRQFERFFNKRLGQLTSRAYKFIVMFPDLTIYNRSEMLDKYLKTAQYGFPKTLVASALGMTTTELVSLNILENEYLKLDTHLIPLSSSHTQSGKDGEDKRKKSDSEITDKGVQTRDSESNKERTQK